MRVVFLFRYRQWNNFSFPLFPLFPCFSTLASIGVQARKFNECVVYLAGFKDLTKVNDRDGSFPNESVGKLENGNAKGT